jgi:hypothetical protein
VAFIAAIKPYQMKSSFHQNMEIWPCTRGVPPPKSSCSLGLKAKYHHHKLCAAQTCWILHRSFQIQLLQKRSLLLPKGEAGKKVEMGVTGAV